MSVNRVRINWSGPGFNGPGLSTFYFSTNAGTPAQQVAAVQAFLVGTDDERAAGCVWTSDPSVAQLSDSGVLEGQTNVTPVGGTGTLTGDTLSPTTQGLLRLATSQVVAGRLLKGRLFLPAPTESVNQPGGTPTSGYAGDYNGAAATLLGDPNTNWVVWSRTHGVWSSVLSAATWTKWAVLRSRRD